MLNPPNHPSSSLDKSFIRHFDQYLKNIGSNIFNKNKRSSPDYTIEHKISSDNLIHLSLNNRSNRKIKLDDSLSRDETRQHLDFSLNPSTLGGKAKDYSDYLLKDLDESPNPKEPQSRKQARGFYLRNVSVQGRSQARQLNDTADGNVLTQMRSENERLKRNISKLEDAKKKMVEFIRTKLKDIDGANDFPFDSSMDDGKTDSASLHQKLVNMSVKNNLMKSKIESLEKENEELKKSLAIYRKSVIERKVGDGPIPAFGRLRTQDYEKLSIPINPVTEPKVLKDKFLVDIGFGDKLARILMTFSKQNSFSETLASAAKECCHILSCEYTRILLVDPSLRKCYTESGGVGDKVNLGPVEMNLIVHKKATSVDENLLNSVESVQELKKVINNQGFALSCPVFASDDSDELLAVIQVLKPLERPSKGLQGKKARIFRMVDERLLELFSKFVCLMMGCHQKDWLLKEEIKRNTLFSESIMHLVKSRSVQDLQENCQVILPQYFGFESVGLLFCDKDYFFSFDTHKAVAGEFVTTKPLKYSMWSGLSGQMVSAKTDSFFSNDPLALTSFNDGVDNVAGVAKIKNIMIGLLRTETGKIEGVMQLFNKTTGKIDSRDENKMRSIQLILGSLINQSNTVNLTYNITMAVDETIKEMELAVKRQVNELG